MVLNLLVPSYLSRGHRRLAFTPAAAASPLIHPAGRAGQRCRI